MGTFIAKLRNYDHLEHDFTSGLLLFQKDSNSPHILGLSSLDLLTEFASVINRVPAELINQCIIRGDGVQTQYVVATKKYNDLALDAEITLIPDPHKIYFDHSYPFALALIGSLKKAIKDGVYI